MGWVDWEPSNPTVKNALSKCTSKDHVVYVGKSRYSLKGMPGVTEMARPAKKEKLVGGKKSGATSQAEGSADDGGGQDTSQA